MELKVLVQEWFTEAVVALALVLLSWVAQSVRDWLTQRMNADQLYLLEQAARVAVKAAEQMYPKLEGFQRLQRAKDGLEKLVSRYSIHLTDDQKRLLIERAVREMNETKEMLRPIRPEAR